METPRTGGTLTFDTFSLDGGRGCLLADGVEVPLRPKTFALLSHLAANPGRLVSKDELIRAVWRGAIVSDDVLVQSVGELRRALGEKGAAIIRTVPRRGYRFEAEVAVAAPASDPQPMADSPVPDDVPPAAPENMPQPRPVRRRLWPWYAVACVLLLAILSVTTWQVFDRTGSGEAPRREIRTAQRKPAVVVSFGNLDAEPRSVADLRSRLIDALGRFSSLSVNAGEAVASDPEAAAKQDTAARERDVQYRIEGNAQRRGGRTIVSARLVDTDGRTLWPGDFDEKQLGQFAAEVVVAIGRSEQRLAAARPPDNLDAYDHVQRALHEMHVPHPQQDLRNGVIKVRESAQEAIKLDPGYAPAWTLLAEARLAKVVGGFEEFQATGLAKAEEAANYAVTLDWNDIRAHVVRAHLYLGNGRYELAREEADRLMEINPYDPHGLAARGYVLVYLGRTDDAIQALEFVKSINRRMGELGGWDNFSLALAYYLKGRYQDAYDTLGVPEKLPHLEDMSWLPDFVAAPAALAAACLAQQGLDVEAGRAAALALGKDPAFVAKLQAFVDHLRNPADQRHLREGLVRAGLLDSAEAAGP